MKFDDILEILGDFGTYQRIIYMVICLPMIFVAMASLVPVFTMATPDHRCAIPDLLNDTYEIKSDEHRQLIQENIPTSVGTWSLCEVKDDPQNNKSATKSCDKWVYDKTTFSDTIVTELNLVCSRTIYKAHAITARDIGALIGYFTLGPVVDKFGRKNAYLLELFLLGAFQTFAIWLPNIYICILIKAIMGFVRGVLWNTTFVYALEFIGLSKRTLCGILLNQFWAAGLLIQTGMAYQLRYWRHLQLSMSVPIFAFLINWWFIPESPRWLIANGKHDQAQSIISRIAKVNKVKLPDQVVDMVDDSKNEAESQSVFHNLLDILKDRQLTVQSCIFFLEWFVVSLLYYGLSLNLGNLGGNIFVNSAISASVEVVAYTATVPILFYTGRKKLYCSCMLIGGLILISSALIDIYGKRSYHWLMITFAMIGKMVVAAAYATIYLFTAEVYPTVIRSSAIGMCSFCASLGNITAPYVVILGEIIQTRSAKMLPLLVFGICSVIAGVSSLLLPETKNKKLPDIFTDIRPVRNPSREDIA